LTDRESLNLFPMDIVLIGSGNVATVLGRKLKASGHHIAQVYSRNGGHANELAIRLGTSSTSYISSIERRADLMLIALRDEAISPFVKDLGRVKCVLAHTAGALSINELSRSAESFGVMYPLQSLRKEIQIIPPLSVLVDGNQTETREYLKKIADTIAGTVIAADDEKRLKYHLAATLVNNFTNHLFALTESFCKQENISFGVLQPLMEETVHRLRHVSPGEVQTGPAIRDDRKTIEKHLALLENYPAIMRLYALFTDEIQAGAGA
jgi:predicted short-subunit dehydrogenase-like oxidoreductase (DUF2520 family)